MEIIHRVGFNSKNNENIIETLKQFEIKSKSILLPGAGGSVIFFDISELNQHFQFIENLIKTKNMSDVTETYFTSEEILKSLWVRIIPIYELGYPQPQNYWNINHPNYSYYCKTCGIFRQSQEFRIKDEPKFGKRMFATLFWTYSLLCATQVITDFSKMKFVGFEWMKVIIDKSSLPSRNVKQLVIQNIAKKGFLNIEKLKKSICPECGTEKYEPHMRGVMHFKKGVLDSSIDFFQTYEWFGSGGSAYREFIVSNRVAHSIIDKGWEGLRFKPVEIE